MFKNVISDYATPIRVYELCCLAERGNCTRDEARKKFCPLPTDADDVIAPIIRVAVELELLEENRDEIILTDIARSGTALTSVKEFRRWCNARSLRESEDLFSRISAVMLRIYDSQETREMVGENFTTSQRFRDYLANHVNMENIPRNMRAWRFWSSFLGLGLVHESEKGFSFLPDMYVCLSDAIKNAKLEAGNYTVTEFMDVLQPFLTVALPAEGEGRKFCLGMANGLRSLHDSGKIIGRHAPDAKEYWELPEMIGHTMPATISHIILPGGIV